MEENKEEIISPQSGGDYTSPEYLLMEHQKLLNELMPVAHQLHQAIGFAPFLHLMNFMLCQLQLQLDHGTIKIDDRYRELMNYSLTKGAEAAFAVMPEVEETFKKLEENGTPHTSPIIIFPKNPLMIVPPNEGKVTLN